MLAEVSGLVKNRELDGYLRHDPHDEFARENRGDDDNGR